MLSHRHTECRIDGINVYNGIYLQEKFPDVAKGLKMLDGVVVTCRTQYKIAEDTIVFANFNSLRKIDKPWLIAMSKVEFLG